MNYEPPWANDVREMMISCFCKPVSFLQVSAYITQ
jgi:hypothetical protein